MSRARGRRSRTRRGSRSMRTRSKRTRGRRRRGRRGRRRRRMALIIVTKVMRRREQSVSRKTPKGNNKLFK